MTPELTVLTLAGLVQVAQYFLMGVPANMQLGPEKTAGPRDEPLALSGVAGRMKRAMDNHFEGLILFTIAVVTVTLGGAAGGFTATCAWVYLIARILYVPAYAFGWTPWRSVIWFGGFLSTIAMLLAALVYG
ncbi:MAPEG family protein [Pikeienuella piscinae]|uniref:MAPEG family protein n=1 Tax=Pikeienuella piscinae TaxID=2748098 RepID=A0A7L5BY35_9RHOB|nr:MAPEG family protein [Pikeienuella piscinae]QIE56835.1 MAPEG family protein [Pikeienuella piscinae]